jgi:hypothetical protein
MVKVRTVVHELLLVLAVYGLKDNLSALLVIQTLVGTLVLVAVVM